MSYQVPLFLKGFDVLGNLTQWGQGVPKELRHWHVENWEGKLFRVSLSWAPGGVHSTNRLRVEWTAVTVEEACFRALEEFCKCYEPSTGSGGT